QREFDETVKETAGRGAGDVDVLDRHKGQRAVLSRRQSRRGRQVVVRRLVDRVLQKLNAFDLETTFVVLHERVRGRRGSDQRNEQSSDQTSHCEISFRTVVTSSRRA